MRRNYNNNSPGGSYRINNANTKHPSTSAMNIRKTDSINPVVPSGKKRTKFVRQIKIEIRDLKNEINRKYLPLVERQLRSQNESGNSNSSFLITLLEIKKTCKIILKTDLRKFSECEKIQDRLQELNKEEKEILRRNQETDVVEGNTLASPGKNLPNPIGIACKLLFGVSSVARMVNYSDRKRAIVGDNTLSISSRRKGSEKSNNLNFNVKKIKNFNIKINSNQRRDSPLISPSSPQTVRTDSKESMTSNSPKRVVEENSKKSGKDKFATALKNVVSLLSLKKKISKKSQRKVVCRLCEEKLLASDVYDHTVFCEKREQSRVKFEKGNNGLRDLLKNLRNIIDQTFQKENKMRELDEIEKNTIPKLVKITEKVINIKIKKDGKKKLDAIMKKLRKMEANTPKVYKTTKEGKKRVCRTLPNYLSALIRHCKRKEVHLENALQFPGVNDLANKRKKLQINDFHLKGLIACGAYGRVYLCSKKTTGDLYAIKVIELDEATVQRKKKNLLNERDIMVQAYNSSKDISNPYVARIFFSFQGKKFLYLVMEFCPGGDLLTLLRRERILEYDQVKQYVCEIIECYDFFRKSKIIHRDIKPENILIDRKGHIKLTDFGLSEMGLLDRGVSNYDSFGGVNDSFFGVSFINLERVDTLFGQSMKNMRTPMKKNRRDSSDSVSSTTSTSTTPRVERIRSCFKMLGSPDSSHTANNTTTIKGTPDYLAPEVLLGKNHNSCVDYWALGVVTFQLLIGFTPFGGSSPDAIFNNILNGEINWPANLDLYELPDECIDFIKRLLTKNTKRRLGVNGINQIRDHPWFSGVDWEKVKEQTPQFIPMIEKDSLELFEQSQKKIGFNEEDLLNDFQEGNTNTLFVNEKALIEVTRDIVKMEIK